MMCFSSIYKYIMHHILSQDLTSNFCMRFSACRIDLSDVMQKSCFLCKLSVQSHLICKHLRESCYFNTMQKKVLTITVSDMKPSNILYDLRLHHWDVEKLERLFSFFHKDIFCSFDGLIVDLLDVDRIDSSVFDECVHCFGCKIPFFWIITRKFDRKWSVIDCYFYSRHLFKRSNISSFPPNNLSFHVLSR